MWSIKLFALLGQKSSFVMAYINFYLLASILFVAGISGRVFTLGSHLSFEEYSFNNILCVLGLICAGIGAVMSGYFANLNSTDYGNYFFMAGAIIYILGEILILFFVHPKLKKIKNN